MSTDSRWYLSVGGADPVGPVSLDQISRGVAAGKIPRDAVARPEGSNTWSPVAAVLSASAATPPQAGGKANITLIAGIAIAVVGIAAAGLLLVLTRRGAGDAAPTCEQACNRMKEVALRDGYGSAWRTTPALLDGCITNCRASWSDAERKCTAYAVDFPSAMKCKPVEDSAAPDPLVSDANACRDYFRAQIGKAAFFSYEDFKRYRWATDEGLSLDTIDVTSADPTAVEAGLVEREGLGTLVAQVRASRCPDVARWGGKPPKDEFEAKDRETAEKRCRQEVKARLQQERTRIEATPVLVVDLPVREVAAYDFDRAELVVKVGKHDDWYDIHYWRAGWAGGGVGLSGTIDSVAANSFDFVILNVPWPEPANPLKLEAVPINVPIPCAAPIAKAIKPGLENDEQKRSLRVQIAFKPRGVEDTGVCLTGKYGTTHCRRTFRGTGLAWRVFGAGGEYVPWTVFGGAPTVTESPNKIVAPPLGSSVFIGKR